jgi:hypothetical protein
MRAARIKLVALAWAQIQVIMLGLPRPAHQLRGYCGTVHPESAGDLRRILPGSPSPAISIRPSTLKWRYCLLKESQPLSG